MKGLSLIVRNIVRQPRRALLTMLTFAATTFIFVVLVSIPASIDMILKETSQTLRLSSYNADGRYLGLPARYCGEIERMPGVVACTPAVFFAAKYQSAQEIIQAFAIDANKLGPIFPDYGVSRKVLAHFEHNRLAAVAGKLLIRRHRWKIGDVITLRGDYNRLDIRFILVGEIPSNNYPNFFVFRRDYLVEAEKAIGISEEKHPPAFLETRADSAEDTPRVIREIDETFHNSDFETATMTESEVVSGLMSTVGNIRGIVYGVFVAILLTVLLIAANAMSMMVRDRLSDVAVLRALGFGPLHIAMLLFGEAALIGTVGGVLGALPALWLFGGGTTLGAVLENVGYLTITGDAAAEALVAAISVSLFSAILPVLGALHVTPADAFRKAI